MQHGPVAIQNTMSTDEYRALLFKTLPKFKYTGKSIMAASIVQNLFEDALDTWSPIKTTIFMDNETCNSPMMDYIIKTKKSDKPAASKSDTGSNGFRTRRCRTLKRTGTNTNNEILKLSSCDLLQALSEEKSENDDVFVTSRKSHDLDTSLLLNEGSSDSGVRFDEEADTVSFAVPSSVPTRRMQLFEEDACSPLIYSPVKSINVPTEFPSFPSSGSDDGFFEDIIAVDDTDDNVNLTGTLASLFKAPVIKALTPKTEDFQIKKPICMKLNGRLDSLAIQTKGDKKRPLSEDADDVNPFQKRRRGCGNLLQRSCSEELPREKPACPLKRFMSANDAIIQALDRAEENPDLIGDGSVSYCLPTIPGKHQDLKSITPETLSKVINHEYDHIVEKYVIIDCRYPYEFDGGHIQGGLNYYTKDLIMDNIMKEPMQPVDSNKRVALIFHCEFSSERAPKMSRFLRNMDRDLNKQCYPHLFYPEIYLLHGGYKNFFENQLITCEPQTYMPMLHEDYKEDMRRFRMKSKSWAGDKKTKSARGRLGF